jgi:hypothetical protein
MDLCAMVLFGIFGTQLLLEAYKLHKQEANDSEMRSLLVWLPRLNQPTNPLTH